MKRPVKAKRGRPKLGEARKAHAATRGGSRKKAAPVKSKRARRDAHEPQHSDASTGGNGGRPVAEPRAGNATVPATKYRTRARQTMIEAQAQRASAGGNSSLLMAAEAHYISAVIPAIEPEKRARHRYGEAQLTRASTGGNGGHYVHEPQVNSAAIPATDSEYARQTVIEPHGTTASIGGDDCQKTDELQNASAIIPTIQGLWRRRQMWVKARTSLTLQAKAECRRACDGDKAAGAELLKRIQKNEALSTQTELDAAHSCGPILVAYQVLDSQIKPIEKKLISLASQLPVAQWARRITGFGVDGTSLAGLIGECGDIGGYATVSKLWKRLGLAVIKGERQQKKRNVEEALEHGYNPPRHAVAWNVSQSLFKAKANNDYGAVYEYRREHTAMTHPDWTPKHAQNDAVRYMLKRFLSHFWAEWRRRSNAYGPAYE